MNPRIKIECPHCGGELGEVDIATASDGARSGYCWHCEEYFNAYEVVDPPPPQVKCTILNGQVEVQNIWTGDYIAFVKEDHNGVPFIVISRGSQRINLSDMDIILDNWNQCQEMKKS